MIVYDDGNRTLHAYGVDDDSWPFLLCCTCNHCGQEISRRVYHLGADEGDIDEDAMQDAKAAKRHLCQA